MFLKLKPKKFKLNNIAAETRIARPMNGRKDSNKMATISFSGASGRRRRVRRYFYCKKIAVPSFSFCFLE